MTEVVVLIAVLVGFKLGMISQRSTPPVKETVKAKEKKEAENPREKEKERKRLEIIETCLDNIDAYNGTGLGQKEIPYEEEETDLWT